MGFFQITSSDLDRPTEITYYSGAQVAFNDLRDETSIVNENPPGRVETQYRWEPQFCIPMRWSWLSGDEIKILLTLIFGRRHGWGDAPALRYVIERCDIVNISRFNSI